MNTHDATDPAEGAGGAEPAKRSDATQRVRRRHE